MHSVPNNSFTGPRRQLLFSAAALGLASLLSGSTFAQASASPVAPAASGATPTEPLLLEGSSPVTKTLPIEVAAIAAPASTMLPAASDSLPDAPEPQVKPLNAPPSNPRDAAHVAPLRAKFIPAGWTAQPLGVRGKILVGATDLYSFSNFAAMFLSAGYEHLTDGQPNYGVNSTAFAQRLGAAAVRETSQGVFTDMVFAPLLHEDPRYFAKGPAYNPVRRTLYAITRPLVTRTDSGRSSVNGALLLGYAASAALTPAYYPQINRNFRDVASVYGGSIGGAALGFFVSEFSNDVLEALHLKRTP